MNERPSHRENNTRKKYFTYFKINAQEKVTPTLQSRANSVGNFSMPCRPQKYRLRRTFLTGNDNARAALAQRKRHPEKIFQKI
jgi:hypothetical protein